MKKLLALTLAAVTLLSSTAYAQTSIIYDSKAVEYSTQEPVIVGERTYVPIRDVFEAIGFKVEWDNATKIAELDNDYYHTLVNTNNSVVLILNRAMEIKAFKLNDEVQLINGRTMLPLREIVEAMGYEIEWDAETKSSVINDKNDYAYFESEGNKLAETFAGESYNYEVDESKPVGSFSEEELAYFKRVNDIFESIGDLSNDNIEETVANLSKKVTELATEDCPESLTDFRDAFIKGLTASGVYMLNAYKCEQLLYEGMDESSEYGDFGLKLVMMAEIVSEIKPASKILYDICAERNIASDSLGELVEG